jgi:hypothetical protein
MLPNLGWYSECIIKLDILQERENGNITYIVPPPCLPPNQKTPSTLAAEFKGQRDRESAERW